MSSFRQLMMRSKGGGEPNPPANVVFENVDSNHYITYKARDGQHYWRKTSAGLAYGGFYVFADGGQNWMIAMVVSEVRQNCAMNRDNWSTSLTISTTTFNYKGKDWYYTLNDNANPAPTNQTDIDWNKNNSPSYWIGGENVVFSGTNKFIDCAKALLDYVYSF